MFDPAAMGTLLIGLDLDGADGRPGRPGRSVAARRRDRSVRVALARGLRRAASALEPRPVGELAHQPG